MSTKIIALELENVKKIRAVRLEPSEKGLTIIGGNNGQGKTSVLDSIAYALGGEKFKPSNIKRDGAIGDPFIHIETNDGLIVERKGKNSSLTVTDKEGKKGGQAILNQLIGNLAIDLPKFLNSTPKQKADILLDTLGIGEELLKLENLEKGKYNTRTIVGQRRDQKKEAAKDMEWFEDAPAEELSSADLINRHKEALQHNAENDRCRRMLKENSDTLDGLKSNLTLLKATYEEKIKDLSDRIAKLTKEVAKGKTEVSKCEDVDTTELEKQIEEFDAVNQKVRTNRLKEEKIAEADDLSDEYDRLTAEINDIRQQKLDLLNGAELPLPGLSVENGELMLNGKSWDCMSGSQKLIVGASICYKVNPRCGFVLLDGLEQMDLDTLKDFDGWLKEKGLQAIATRVSKGDECSVIIEDGEALSDGKEVIPLAKKEVCSLEDEEY